MMECARGGALQAGESVLFFLLDQQVQEGDQRVLSFYISFEELKYITVLSANDLWTEEEEWEGSLRDIWKGEGKTDELER